MDQLTPSWNEMGVLFAETAPWNKAHLKVQCYSHCFATKRKWEIFPKNVEQQQRLHEFIKQWYDAHLAGEEWAC